MHSAEFPNPVLPAISQQFLLFRAQWLLGSTQIWRESRKVSKIAFYATRVRQRHKICTTRTAVSEIRWLNQISTKLEFPRDIQW